MILDRIGDGDPIRSAKDFKWELLALVMRWPDNGGDEVASRLRGLRNGIVVIEEKHLGAN